MEIGILLDNDIHNLIQVESFPNPFFRWNWSTTCFTEVKFFPAKVVYPGMWLKWRGWNFYTYLVKFHTRLSIGQFWLSNYCLLLFLCFGLYKLTDSTIPFPLAKQIIYSCLPQPFSRVNLSKRNWFNWPLCPVVAVRTPLEPSLTES